MAHGCDVAVGPVVPAGVDAVGGQAHRVGHLDVGRREAEQAARWSPITTLPRTSCCRPSSWAASSTSPPARARRIAVLLIGSSIPSARATRSDGVDDEVVVGAVRLEQADVALAVAAEVEVLADDDDLHGEAVDEHPLDERLRRLLGLDLVEVQHHGAVEPGRGQQLQALLRRRQQLRRRLRPDDRGRVAVEREDHGVGAFGGGEALDLGDDRLVAEMHAVVGADRDHGALAGPGRGDELGDHLHGR